MIKKILVIQQKMIGDVLVSSIVCQNLALEFPQAQIDYLVHDGTLPVLENNHSNFNIIPFSHQKRTSKIELIKFALHIRKKKYDVVIDCYSKLESWIITGLSGASKRISFDKGYLNFLYTDVIKRHKIPITNWGLTIEQRLNLLKPLGITQPKVIKPTLVVNEKEKLYTQAFLNKNNVDSSRPLIMVSVLGSSESKTYPLSYMAQVIDWVIEYQPMNLLFNYIPTQRTEAEKLYHLCKPETQKYIYFDAIGKFLRDFIGLMDACTLIIGNDGGAINMAKALNKPAFTIFSPMIDKLGWNSFEDGNKYISVHLKDYHPEKIEKLSNSELKIQNDNLYLDFHPELFKPLLTHFLKQNA